LSPVSSWFKWHCLSFPSLASCTNYRPSLGRKAGARRSSLQAPLLEGANPNDQTQWPNKLSGREAQDFCTEPPAGLLPGWERVKKQARTKGKDWSTKMEPRPVAYPYPGLLAQTWTLPSCAPRWPQPGLLGPPLCGRLPVASPCGLWRSSLL
jgi:hypothetical protein